MRSWFHFAVLAIACALAIAVFSSWRAERLERSRLQSELAETQKTLAALDAKQKNREAELAQTLKQLAQQKRAVQTPSEALRELPKVLPLPVPIQEQSVASAPPTDVEKAKLSDSPPPKAVVLPSEDLKPLYDFAVDCQACQARLAASQADLADEQAKTQALSRERDAALRIARGGSFWKRLGRAAKWFAIGAAAGAIAEKPRINASARPTPASLPLRASASCPQAVASAHSQSLRPLHPQMAHPPRHLGKLSLSDVTPGKPPS